MPAPKGKKGNDKAKGKEKGSKTGQQQTEHFIMKNLLKVYERNCHAAETQPNQGLRSYMNACIEEEKCLSKFIIEAKNTDEDPTLLEPFFNTIRNSRYEYMKDLHIWNYPFSYENIAILALLLQRPFVKVRMLDFIDCLIEAYSIKRLASSFKFCDQLTTINLDYNEFGDQGCDYLCHGLIENKTVLSLSLCYCRLGHVSGRYLGNLISTTAVRELFLDGNDLECEGAMDLIMLCVDQSEKEAFLRMETAQYLEEQKLQKAEEEKLNRFKHRSAGESSDGGGKSSKDKKKKKGKKKKSKEPPGPPPVGPWLHKLHLADNGIDGLGEGKKFAPVIVSRLFKKLVWHSECLVELDLDDNLIGDMGGQEIVTGLTLRIEEKLPGIKVRVTHRMNSDTFDAIVKMGSGLVKKDKKKGKKKKKK